MQNRYTGDLGDFSKLGILRILRAEGLSIGVNWYLTPDESHNSDGRHINYLDKKEYMECDEGLWLELRDIVKNDRRKVRYLEKESIIRATFYSECLDLSGKPRKERQLIRKEWHRNALAALSEMDIACLDPDNGLLVPSAAGTIKENKYVLQDELVDYYAHGSSVIYYQHKARKKDSFYIHQFASLINSGDFNNASGLALKFKTTSQRYYFFIIQPRHRSTIERAVSDMLSTAWDDHFSLLK